MISRRGGQHVNYVANASIWHVHCLHFSNHDVCEYPATRRNRKELACMCRVSMCSRQGTNPRAIVRGGRRALRYGDLAEVEGASAGAQRASRWLMRRAADSSKWVCFSRLSLKGAVAGWL